MNRRTLIVAAVAALLGGSAVTWADKKNKDALDAAKLQQSGEILPKETILERAKAQKPGKVVEAELERKHGRYVYEIDVLGDDGVKTELKYDAKTGELLSSKVENDDDDDD
jgi:uncharacterized membrane protein YkoI